MDEIIKEFSKFVKGGDFDKDSDFFYDDSYLYDDPDYECPNLLISEEKAYVCDFNTVYVCLYEELNEYQNLKEEKEGDKIAAWNNILVETPTGGVSLMEQVPEMLDRGEIVQAEGVRNALQKLRKVKKMSRCMFNSIKEDSNNSNFRPEFKGSKVASAQNQKLAKKKLKKQRQKERKKGEKKDEKSEEKDEKSEEKDEEEKVDPEEEGFTEEEKSRSRSRAASLEFQKKMIDEESEEDENSTDLSSGVNSALASYALEKNKKILTQKEEKSVKKSVKISDTSKSTKKDLVKPKAIEKKTEKLVDPDFIFPVKKEKMVEEECEEDENSTDLSSGAIPPFVSNTLKKNKKIFTEKEEKSVKKSVKNSDTSEATKKISVEPRPLEKKTEKPVFDAEIPVIPSLDPDFVFSVKKEKMVDEEFEEEEDSIDLSSGAFPTFVSKAMKKNKKILIMKEEKSVQKSVKNSNASKATNKILVEPKPKPKPSVDPDSVRPAKKEKMFDEECEEEENSIDLSSGAIPAFVSSALKKNKKILIKEEEKSVKKSVNIPNTAKSTKQILVERKPIENKTKKPADPEYVFPVKKIKLPKISENLYLESVALGKEAHRLILCDNISDAIEFLEEAILISCYDLRHFLNRSYCYLRICAYSSALKDAQYVIKHSNEKDERLTAMFRAGQAHCRLKNYDVGIKYLDEAYNLSQGHRYIHGELMRVKILQLCDMGFRERDIIEAFKECSSVLEVVAILAEKTIVEEDDDHTYGGESDDDIYISDDEENPSLTRSFCNMLNCQTALRKLPFTNSSPMRMAPPMQPLTALSYRKPVVTEAKKIITTLTPKAQLSKERAINDKAVWVGSTTYEVTENMLRKSFTRFGEIVSIYRKPSESYTFINFETSKAVTELLSSASVVEVDGHKLPVKAATKSK